MSENNGKCPYCNGNKVRTAFVTEKVDLFKRCPDCTGSDKSGEYGSGVYATPHVKCGGEGCPECSSVEEQGIAGRVLDKFLTGPNDKPIIWYKKCWTCRGNGKLYVGAVKKTRKIEVPCLHCIDGKSLSQVLDTLKLQESVVPSNVTLDYVQTQEKVAEER